MLPFFPRNVLDEIWDLIESDSGVFLPTLKDALIYILHLYNLAAFGFSDV